MDAAVTRTVLIELESHFTKWPVRLFERRNDVCSPKPVCDLFRRAVCRRAASDLRLRMTDEALVGVEHRAHARGVHQPARGKWVLRIRVDWRQVRRLLRARITRAFQLGNPQ